VVRDDTAIAHLGSGRQYAALHGSQDGRRYGREPHAKHLLDNSRASTRFGPHPVKTPALLFYGVPAMVWCVLRLTKQEQLVLCIILSLLLVGWAVKVYRTAHPAGSSAERQKTKYHASPEF
jgi:hypothetical protein